jgi:hypothetical protein
VEKSRMMLSRARTHTHTSIISGGRYLCRPAQRISIMAERHPGSIYESSVVIITKKVVQHFIRLAYIVALSIINREK